MICVKTAARFRLVASSIRSTPEVLDARASTSDLYAPSPMTRAIWGISIWSIRSYTSGESRAAFLARTRAVTYG